MSTDAIAAARTFLPAWVVWSPLASLALAGLASALLATVAVVFTSRPLRRLPSDAHWTERARLVWPVRRSMMVAWVLAAVLAALIAMGGPLSRPGILAQWMLGLLVTVVPAFAVGFAFENRHVRRVPASARWRSAAGYLVVVLPAYWVSGAFGIWADQIHLPAAWSLVSGTMLVFLVIGAAPWLGRLVGLVGPAPPRLEAALRRVQEGIGGRPARLLVLPMASANAFAFLLTRTIGVTRGALDLLDDEELGAVLAHELGHLREPRGVVALRTTVAALVPVALVMVPWLFHLWSELAWGALLALVVGVLMVYVRLQRRLERRADAVGSTASAAYARVLEKLYRANLAPAVLRRAGSHPNLFDRMAAAGAKPAWPRPPPPPALRSAVYVLVLAAGALFAGTWQLRSLGLAGDRDEGTSLRIRVAVDGGASDVGGLGLWHLEHGEKEAALAMLRAAEAMDQEEAGWPAWVATVLAYQGRCQEAAEASRRASSRDPDSPYVKAAKIAAASCAAPRE